MNLLFLYLSCTFNFSLLLIFLHNNFFNNPYYLFTDCIKGYYLFKKHIVSYETYCDINHAYSDFIGKLTNSIDKVAPTKVIRLKSRSEDWFDGEICNAIKIKNKTP